MKKTICLEVCNGLGNRLESLIAGMCLAEDLHSNIVVYWPPSQSKCAAAFFDLFQQNCLPNWVRIIDGYAPRQKILCVTQKEALNAALMNKPILSWANFHTTDPKRWCGHLKKLLPVPVILSQVRRNFSVIPQHHVPVGVHIRRTDNKNSISESPLEAFQSAMSKITNGFFYVASDEVRVVQQLKKRFSDRVYSHETLRNRNTVEGIREAVVSLYTLAYCSLILGSYGSSFSRVAARIGSKECQLVRKSLKSKK